jgi:hypothetical protein
MSGSGLTVRYREKSAWRSRDRDDDLRVVGPIGVVFFSAGFVFVFMFICGAGIRWTPVRALFNGL